MKFSLKSDVTLVITSCNRFDLLKKTIESFSRNNTYPIREVIIIEDSGNFDINQNIPNEWLEHTKILVNEINLGQIKPIDKAYKHVTTDFIFHCEHDWLLNREGFIEDSIKILRSNKDIITVWLRDIENDVIKNYPFHFVCNEEIIDQIYFYKLGSTDSSWRGFTFNPTLKRKIDYELLGQYERQNMKALDTESFLSIFYEALGMSTAILKCSAVEHIGWNDHVFSFEENKINKKINKKKNRKKFRYILIGIFLGIILTLTIQLLIKNQG